MNIFNVPMYVSSGHSREVKSVAFSPDGNTIASGSWDNSIKLWNPQTGDLIRTLDGNKDMLPAVYVHIYSQLSLFMYFQNESLE